MKKLIRQIRSLGSLFREYGVHVSSMMRKPEVSFKAPTYIIGGSDSSFTRRGGLILVMGPGLLMVRQLGVMVRQVRAFRTFLMEITFLREDINKIKGFDYGLCFRSHMINFDREASSRIIFPATSQ